MYNREKVSKICNFFFAAAIILITGWIVYTNLFHYCYKMNADIASEAVLARCIWESGEWLPKSWYPSTELRFFSTPNLAALFYGILHDMNLAMGIACSIITFGVLASAYFFICQCSFQREEKLIFILLCLISPNNFVILELFYLFGAYYAIHVIFMFFTMGIYLKMIRTNNRCGLIMQGIAVFMSLIMGIQGLRGILVLGIPLLMTEMLRQIYMIYKGTWRKKSLYAAGWPALILLAGYVGTLMPVSVGQETTRNIRNVFAKLLHIVIQDIMRCLGLTEKKFSGGGYAAL